MTASLVMHMYLLADYFCTGGFIMGPLLAVSLIMWVLIIERVLYLGRLSRKPMGVTVAWQHICDNRMPDSGNHKGGIALLVATFLQERSGDHVLDRHILDEIVLTLNRSLTDYLEIIAVLAALAPLMGLLGTVTGMMSTFDVLSIFGTGNVKAMAKGISEALVTTETGLVVAIPGLYMKSFLERRAANLRQRIAMAGYYLSRQLQEKTPC